jgi:autotransporter-associated beta strand protein
MIIASVIFSATVLSAIANNLLMVNFSSTGSNDLIAADATALGVDAYQNVRTGTTGNGTTAAISLDGVTGGVSYADYYQANQKTALGQPYATLVGAKLITAGTGSGSNRSVSIALDLSDWMTAGDYTSYQVTVYYAGRSAAVETLMTDATADVHFSDGTLTPDDTVTVVKRGSGTYAAYWGGIGASHEFTGSNLTINMDYLGGTSSGFQAGISAIRIQGFPVPEPPQELLWTGAASGEWSNAILAGTKNWKLASDGTTPSDFEDLDTAIFNDTLATFTTTTVNISNGDVQPAAVSFLNDSSALTLTGSNGIAGPANLSVSGSAGLRIENANTFTGTTTHTLGELVIANENALQNSVLTTSYPEIVSFDGITAATLGALGGNGDLVLENSAPAALALTLGNGNKSGTHSGEISGSGSVIKIGTGSQSFNFLSTYTGGTTVNSGPAYATATNTAGAIQVGVSSALGTGPVAFTNTADTSILRFTADNVELPNAITLSSAAGITSEINVTNAQTAILSGKISGGEATSFLFQDSSAGSATSVLKLTNPDNDFVVSRIRMWRGSLAITSDGALGNADNDIEIATESVNGALRFDANNITLNANRSIIFYASTASEPINTQEFTATIAGDFSGQGTFRKQGTGKLILTGTNNATGTTSIDAGTLEVNGTFASGGGTVTASAAGTISGTGTINRSVVINGKLAPGASVGTLTTTAPLTLGADSGYTWEIADWNGAAGTGYDTTVVDSLTIAATSTNPVTIAVTPQSLANFTNASKSFTLISTATGITGFAADAFVVDASALPAATGTWSVEENGNNLNLVFTFGTATPFESWASTNITAINPLAPAGFDDDADGDGIANGLEWILGGGPLAQDAASLLTTTATGSGGLILSFDRAEDSIGQATLTVEWDTDLGGGFANSIPIDTAIAPSGDNPSVAIDTGATPDAVIVTIPAANAVNGRIFARLRAVLP